MTVTTETSRGKRRARALVVATSLVAASAVLGITSPAANAAAPTDVYLGGLGLFTAACPVTPSNVVYVQPGTTLRFHADATGLGASGGPLIALQTSMTNPLNNQQSFTVSNDANGYHDIGFGSQGTYGFTWNAQLGSISVTVPGSSGGSSGGGGGGLGGVVGGVVGSVGGAVGGAVGGVTGSVTKTVQVPLLAQTTGAKLSWAGQIVVSSQAQNCKLAVQLPSINVSPSLPVIGKLPGISVPGTQLPSASVPGTTANPSTTATTPGAATTPGTTTSTTTTTTNPFGYDAPDCTGPCAVVPRGSGSGGTVGSAYDVTLGDLGIGSSAVEGAPGSSGGSGGGDGAQQFANGGGDSVNAANAAALFDTGSNGSSAVDTSVPTALGAAAGVVLAVVGLAAGLPWARRRLARR